MTRRATKQRPDLDGDAFAEPPLDQILVGDCLDALARLPAKSVDLVFADPPYNLQLKGELRRPDHTRVAGVVQNWDKFSSYAAYDAFTRAWLSAARRVMKDDAGLWVIGAYHNIFRIGAALQDMGFWILNDVVWRKTNPMPNFRGTRMTNAHETLIWCAKSEAQSGYKFNYEALKSLNDGLQMRSDWLLPICSGAERVKTAAGETAHPTQKPEALVARALIASTDPGDVVLDPFLGVGTTAAAAKRLGRRYIGVERDPDYAALAEARLASVEPHAADALAAAKSKRRAQRVPFGALIERRLLAPGQMLTSPDGRATARIRVDGALATQDFSGSIHQVAAHVSRAPTMNGWTYWMFDNQGAPAPIDVLRERVRAELEAQP